MIEDLAAEPAEVSPLLVYRLAHSSSLKLAGKFTEHGMPDLLPRHALQLFPLLLGGGLRASDLAVQLGVSRQAIAQVVTTLERGGYVTRIDHPGDRRARLVCLTARGRSACRMLRNSIQELDQDWEERLGRRRLDELRKILTILLNNSA